MRRLASQAYRLGRDFAKSGTDSAGSSFSRTASSCSGAASVAQGISPRSAPCSKASGIRLFSYKGQAQNTLFETVEARMSKIRKAHEQQAAVAQADEAPSTVGKVMGVLGDAAMLSLAGVVSFVGYYSLAYRDTKELEAVVKDRCATNNAAFSNSSSVLTVPPAASPSSSSSSSSSEGSETASESPLAQIQAQATNVWCRAVGQYLRARKAIEEQVESYTAPTYHKLLPDMQPELRGRVKTLVLDLEDLLVHREWTRKEGWKIFRRPGVVDFLFEMGGYYEVVLFTDQPSSYAEPIINKLDPHRMVLYRLYKPETQYHEGKHVRDLSKLNRDLSQVLMISAHPEAWEFQPENTIKLKPWDPKSTDPSDPHYKDTTLLDLIPMLQLIATKGVKDTRDVVRTYDGEADIPKAFKARMSQIAAGQQNKPSKPKSILGSLAR